MATPDQTKRVQQDWTQYAGEPVRVEDIGGTFYGFASELGTLRIYRKYGHMNNISQGYSSNLESFYFSLTPRY